MSYLLDVDDFSQSDRVKIEKMLTFTFKNPFGANLTIPAFSTTYTNSDQGGTPRRCLAVPFQAGLKLAGVTNKEIKTQYDNKNSWERKPWKFTGTLRDEQEELKKKAFPVFLKTGSVSLFLACSFGKSITAANFAADAVGKTGGRVLVTFSRVILETQWLETFEKFTDANACILQESIVRHRARKTKPAEKIQEECQIVISRIGRTSQFIGPVDVLILDEAHELCTEGYLLSLLKLQPKYVIILTATPERDDGMHKILTAMGGDKKHQFWALSKKPFKVFPLISGYGVNDCKAQSQDSELPELPPDSSRINLESALASLQERNDKIIRMLRRIVSKTNFKIMVIGDRIAQLDYIYQELLDKGVDVSRLYSKYKKAVNARVLVAGIKLAGTGFDEKNAVADWDGINIDLGVFIISTYKVVQPVGRILRSNRPKLIQIIDNHKWFKKTNKDNIETYKELNGEIYPEGDWKTITQNVIDEYDETEEETEPLIIGGGEDETIPEIQKPMIHETKEQMEVKPRITLTHPELKLTGHA